MTRAVLALLVVAASTASADSAYTQRMFRRAVSKDNMAISGSMGLSPLFVLITLRDKREQQRTVCTLATFLTGAIIEEFHLDYDTAGERKAFQIAMVAPNRTFAFRNRKVIRNVQPRYTPEQLSTARLRLAKKSRAQLRAEVEQDYSDVTKLYRRYYRDRPGFWHSDEWRDGGSDGKLAEPGQKWNATDAISDPTLPGKRLIWAAVGGDYYVVHYERGGIAHTFYILVAKFSKNDARAKAIWRAMGGPFKDYAAFLDALRSEKLDDRLDYPH